jgi:hypothetical protein
MLVFKFASRLILILTLVAIVVLVLLLYLPSTNYIGNIIVNWLGGDSVVHVVVGFIFPLILAFLFSLGQATNSVKIFYWLFFLCLFAIDEAFQSLSYVRKSELQDFLFSFSGLSLAFCFWLLFQYLKKLK